jgi:hypothetical protein
MLASASVPLTGGLVGDDLNRSKATTNPRCPSPNVLPDAPQDFLLRRIPLIKPGNASSKFFPSRRPPPVTPCFVIANKRY